jgi:hypothetical protein
MGPPINVIEAGAFSALIYSSKRQQGKQELPAGTRRPDVCLAEVADKLHVIIDTIIQVEITAAQRILREFFQSVI